LFGIKRQVYYRAVSRINQRQQIATQVVKLIENVRIKMPRIGTRKLYYLLEDQMRELGVGRDRLFAISKANHLQIVPKRQYHITTDSHHHFRKHKNLVESMIPQRPEQIWVSDITYLGTRTNPMYLSLVTDAYSKRIMGFNVSQSLNASGALAALESAIKNRRYSNQKLIHHSEYCLEKCV
jgi:putative transposase